ncbi:MAG: hypothetical protein ACRYFS_19550 [Janthinobacterium lividum]
MELETTTFEGWDAVRLTNGDAELVVTTSMGPRIIRYGLIDGPNAFQVIPETRGQTGGDTWQPYGGHRLWHAPEVKPRSYHPDNAGYGTPAMVGDTLSIVSPTESTTGIAKEMRVTLAAAGSAVKVEHILINNNVWPVTLSAWALSIVAGGGKVVLPQEPFVAHDDELLPARPLVLWKFTDMADPRWRWGTRYLTLAQRDDIGTPQKVGLYNAQGWGAHVTPAQAFVIRILPAPGSPANLPDMGCNFETFTKGAFQELETLGPLTALEPGQSVSHTELWFLSKLSAATDTDDALDAALLPVVREAQARTAEAFG